MSDAYHFLNNYDDIRGRICWSKRILQNAYDGLCKSQFYDMCFQQFLRNVIKLFCDGRSTTS